MDNQLSWLRVCFSLVGVHLGNQCAFWNRRGRSGGRGIRGFRKWLRHKWLGGALQARAGAGGGVWHGICINCSVERPKRGASATDLTFLLGKRWESSGWFL